MAKRDSPEKIHQNTLYILQIYLRIEKEIIFYIIIILSLIIFFLTKERKILYKFM